MSGARSSIFIACIIYFISLVSANDVCVLKKGASCLSAKYSFIDGGMQPGNAIRVSVDLLPTASLELTNSAFQNIATLRFGVNSCSIESSLASIRAYALYKNGQYNTGSTISFDLVALENSLAVYMTGNKILEIPLLVTAPFMLISDSNGSPPTLQFIEYSSTESGFCSIASSGTCNNSSLVGMSSGITKNLTIKAELPSSIPDDYFSFFISTYGNIYKLPVLEVAFTKEEWLATASGSFVGRGKIPSGISLGSSINLILVPSSGGSVELKVNQSSLGVLKVDPSSIKFIYQSVNQGTMNISY
ncbi:Galactoside-binding lectin [Cryptosporidium ubiquitum]|uniref:Galactoside-binding lectin n=1 Tax=Cryptosporidium ubiquitum TaxID=857276 RepID=A0A1J4MFW1_9CRYT|nr:Galactoside-binding lectin [Cryptosporidium ubiquitum]OII73126.1 Galactoside-binding lectin [Cryptosporidium ubiquitum]